MADVRVLIVDDEALVRRALSFFLDAMPSIEVVGKASDGAEALALCRELRPDVVLMDLRMPGVDGRSAIAELKAQLPEIRAIAVTTYAADDTATEAIAAGAVGFLVKDTEPEQIAAAVHTAHEGGYVLSPAVAQQLILGQGGASRRAPREPLEPCEPVSERELDVIALLARGMSNAEIAAELYVSEATVKSHLRRIMAKWDVRDRVQVLLRAARAGLVDVH